MFNSELYDAQLRVTMDEVRNDQGDWREKICRRWGLFLQVKADADMVKLNELQKRMDETPSLNTPQAREFIRCALLKAEHEKVLSKDILNGDMHPENRLECEAMVRIYEKATGKVIE